MATSPPRWVSHPLRPYTSKVPVKVSAIDHRSVVECNPWDSLEIACELRVETVLVPVPLFKELGISEEANSGQVSERASEIWAGWL